MAFKIGELAFISGLPVHWPLHHGHAAGLSLEFTEGLPGQLDELMARGELDAAPISSVEYVRRPDRYALVPELSISSWGRIGSATLFSKVSMAQLDGQPVALPPDGATSNVLVAWYLQKAFGIQPLFHEADAPLGELLKTHAAALVIGDAAIIETRRNPELMALDMGEAWWQLMQTPLVLSVWAVQSALAEADRSALLALLREAKEAGRAQHADVVAAAAERLHVPASEVEAYYALLNYDMSPVHQQSLDVLAETLPDFSLKS